ncbi:mitochondrial proton/calcium exchanger protein-like protein isoform X1 [Tanacetum coccineum]
MQRTPLHQRLPTQRRRENPRRSLLHAIWWSFQGGGYKATALGFYQRNNANPSYQERRQSIKDTLSKFMSESTKRHEENSNFIKEIRPSTDAAIRNQGELIRTLEIQIGQMSKVLQERGFRSLPSSTEANPRDQVKSISTNIEADSYPIRRIGSSQYAISTRQNRTLIKEKDPGSFTLPCFINNVCFDNALVDLGASVSVMPLLTYLNLGLGGLAHTKLTVELADRTMKYPKGIAENVLVGIGKLVFPIDFIILDMLEDIKVPLILGRAFLSTARVKIDVFKRKNTLRIGEGLFSKASLDPLNGDYIKLNDLNEPFELRRNQGDDLMPTIEEGEFHNSIMNDKMVYKGNNVVGALMNVPIFVETFSVVTDFEVLEDMDAYRDEGMGDVIVGEPFLKEIGIKARWFEGMITIYNGNDEVSEEDKMNGISHAYQKLKGFYRGVLNLGPDYIRDEKTEEWLIRGHISVHEIE